MKRMTTTRFIACWLFLFPLICMAQQDRESDSLALVALYNSTNGINWTNTWDLNLPMDTWHGIDIDSDRVTCIDMGGMPDCIDDNLSGNNLDGSIPPEIGNLTNLRYLSFANNALSGNIPSEIGNLTNAIKIRLVNNQLTGTIPASVGNLTDLVNLNIRDNQLTDTIPAEIGGLTNLKQLNLSSNQFSGNIPPEIEYLTRLEILNLSDNQFTGDILSKISNLTNLEILFLHDNQFSGNMSSEIGNLANLEKMHLFNNQFSGNIPTEIDSLTNLIELLMDTNQFTGNIPASIGNLTNLVDLKIHDNQLIGTIPAAIGSLTNLETLNLSFNQLSGNIPSEIEYLTKLEVLNLSNNQFTGDMLSNIGAMTNLEVLFLQNNQFSGNIPSEIGDLISLKKIYLFNNQFTGSIPPEIGNLNTLIEFQISTNQFTGNIPASIGNLTTLERLALRQNQLSGSIPPEIGNLENLKWLRLSSNDLSDTIPNLENLTQLELLHLTHNDLSGSITHLANLNNLKELKLNANRFSGDIPDFSALPDLTILHLDRNKFSLDALEATYLTNSSFIDFQYSPQYHGESQGYVQDFGDSLTFTLSESLPGNNNQNIRYQWKKNSKRIVGSTDATYAIDNLQLSNVGKYTLHMTDTSRISDLEIISEPIYVIIPGYDSYGQPVEYEQLIIEFDDLQDKQKYETDQLIPNGAFEIDQCSCNRLLYLYQFPNDSIALQILLDMNTKKESTTRRGRLDGGFNNILGIGPISGTQGWTWASEYPHTYPDSVSIFLLDSGTDVQNWDATSYLDNAAPLDSCYNIPPHPGYDYTDTLTSIQSGFTDSIGHGTFGMRSIAEGADAYMNMNVVPLKVFNEDGQGTLFDFICALYHAIDHDADIINISAGYTGQVSGILEDAIALAHSKGQFIVTAAGNEGVNIDSFPQYPAYYAKPFYKIAHDGSDSLVHYNNVISVAAIDAMDSLWQYSNYGNKAATVSAYGENMGGYSHTGEAVSYSGTSISTYYVTRQLATEIAQNNTRSLEKIWTGFEAHYLLDCPATNGLTSTGKRLDISLQEVYSDLRVFLEGAFEPSGDTMRTDLNTLRHILPGQIDSIVDHTIAIQPYHVAPFDYYGIESVPTTFRDYPPEVVDWILVSARTEIDANTTVNRTAAWLLKDGQVQLLQPLFDELATAPDSVYIVIEHRNHMGIMSPQKLPVDRNVVTWDFTVQDAYTISGTGQTLLDNLHWGMLTGDTNNDLEGYDINGSDKSFWADGNGQFGFYLPTDFNMDGDVNGLDKIFWENNNGKFSGVPRY